MIDRDEIDATGKQLGVHPANVQRDYLYGWLLAGLYGNEPLTCDRLVLKGGNAFRKGYFANTRFSGDLDFVAPTGLRPDRFLETLNNVCRMIQARTGVEFDLDRNAQTGQRAIDANKTVHKFALYFEDFYGKPGKMSIALRMDVTEFGRLYLPIQQRDLIHPYSDRADCAATLAVVSLEEALADKLKCLLQRHMSNDLFDLVYSIFVNNDVAVDKKQVVTTFLRKTIFEPSPQAALGLLLAVPFEIMRGYWNKIVCIAASRMDFTAAVEAFKEEMRSLFSAFRHGERNQLAFFPAELRTPIMRAGQEQTLLRITYDGASRLVEPYSLEFKWRKDGSGQEYLYVWDQTGGRSGPGIKSLFNWKITALENTDVKFEPRFEIELAKAGEYGQSTTFAAQRRRGRRVATASTRRRARR
ncbi:nucleotidyl transferase AbiEii/AbiGii toxin family protein [Amycolatopsis sp. NPDC051758]|uniref:nucleotidyl transferase AbiEii/AbiGii toxin family protein n=1 Tax=Amycolatopsis sp. NPDC051758 TaxID=3363935 RepID=UPI0037A480A3